MRYGRPFHGRPKYGNKKVEMDGILFDSKKEAVYYLHLKTRLTKGEISDLRMQVPYELLPAIYETQTVHLKTKDKTVEKCVQKAVHYLADFVYTDIATGKETVVDTKGYKTKDYILKKKMMRALLGITITEV